MIAEQDKKYLKRFANCLTVKGVERGLIFDAQRKIFSLVPLSLIDFLIQSEGKEINSILDQYGSEAKIIANEYLDFLLEKEVAFFCKSEAELLRFPEINLEWDYPAHITNAIVIVKDEYSILSFNAFKNETYIPYIQFNIMEPVNSIQKLVSYVKLMCQGNIKGIQLVFENSNNLPKNEIIALCNQYPIESIIAHNSPFEDNIKSTACYINFITKKINGFTDCGKISVPYFNIQLEHFTESQHHNTCLNRKIAIDAEGNIKNCPSMAKSYGNIKDTKLIDVVNNPEFQKVWHIKKDEISKCKDCEFRHICTDCRAYIENPEDQYSAPLKCGYNPYTCEWEEWSTNPLKQQAIEFYGLQSF